MSGKKMKLLRRAVKAVSREEVQAAQQTLSGNPTDYNVKQDASLVLSRRRFYREAKKGYHNIPGAMRHDVELGTNEIKKAPTP